MKGRELVFLLVGYCTCNSDDGLLARQIGDMDKGIVKGCKDVGYAKDEFSLTDLWAEVDDLFFLRDLLLWRLGKTVSGRCK